MPTDWLMGLVGGLMIGSAGAVLLLFNGRIMGISGIFGGLIDGTGRGNWAERALFVAALVAVPAMMALWLPVDTHASSNWLVLAAGGMLVGVGTRLANGCTSGHGVCGMSRLAPRSIVATLIYVGAGFATVAVLRHGLGWI